MSRQLGKAIEAQSSEEAFMIMRKQARLWQGPLSLASQQEFWQHVKSPACRDYSGLA